MQELSVNSSLENQNLFQLFKLQLKKDFESSGLSGTFVDALPSAFEQLKQVIENELKPLTRNSSTLLNILLYRVDISESQLKKYGVNHPQMGFEELVSELIIKRILQKVIIKKNFSS